MTVFQGARDRYSGVTVTSTAEPCAAEQLEEQLRRSLAAWAADKARSVWFHVAPAEAAWVPVLVNQGFTFHHASPARVALLKWLPEDEPNNVPSYAHTLVGVGGMVVTDDGQLLVVEERFATQPHWKLPGGYVDPGEGLAAAAVREVLEETGVRTEFRSVVAFRHGHDFNFGCSDIYIVVALRPLTTDIKADQKEIAKCRWMPLQVSEVCCVRRCTVRADKGGKHIAKGKVQRSQKTSIHASFGTATLLPCAGVRGPPAGARYQPALRRGLPGGRGERCPARPHRDRAQDQGLREAADSLQCAAPGQAELTWSPPVGNIHAST